MNLYVIKLQKHVHKYVCKIYKMCAKNIKLCGGKNYNFGINNISL